MARLKEEEPDVQGKDRYAPPLRPLAHVFPHLLSQVLASNSQLEDSKGESKRFVMGGSFRRRLPLTLESRVGRVCPFDPCATVIKPSLSLLLRYFAFALVTSLFCVSYLPST